MTFTELYQKYLDVLWSAFQYDIEVFSTPWIYAWLIPASCYLMFFLVKWVVLTLPIWLPLLVVLKPFVSTSHKLERWAWRQKVKSLQKLYNEEMERRNTK